MQRNTSPSHSWSGCWLWPVECYPNPLQWLFEVAGTGTRCSRASQTCSMGDMFDEYAGHGRTVTWSASRNRVQILATWGCALTIWNMRWWRGMNGTAMGLKILSWYHCAFKLPSIKEDTSLLLICAEILRLCTPPVSPAVLVAGLRQSHRWRSWMWRSWAGAVIRGLR